MNILTHTRNFCGKSKSMFTFVQKSIILLCISRINRQIKDTEN